MSACRWIGFRIDTEAPLEAVLTGSLAPWLTQTSTEGLLGRWFFLRYSESGLHLRLRLQPRRGYDPEDLARSLEAVASRSSNSFLLTRQRYDRTALAFGETLESVLAELLHVATSELALALLAQPCRSLTSMQRHLLTAGVAAFIAEKAATGSCLDQLAALWISFAARTVRSHGLTVPTIEKPWADTYATALNALMPRVRAAIANQQSVRSSITLIRKLLRRGDRGRFVAVHGLHLFCNEMGMSIQWEYAVTTALQTRWLMQRKSQSCPVLNDVSMESRS